MNCLYDCGICLDLFQSNDQAVNDQVVNGLSSLQARSDVRTVHYVSEGFVRL
jgi:hypothetical protein